MNTPTKKVKKKNQNPDEKKKKRFKILNLSKHADVGGITLALRGVDVVPLHSLTTTTGRATCLFVCLYICLFLFVCVQLGHARIVRDSVRGPTY